MQTFDVVDAGGNVSAKLEVADGGSATFYADDVAPVRFSSLAEALDRIHAVGARVPDLED